MRGFWKEDVNFATRFYWKPVIKNGKPYVRSILNSYALTPYNSGSFEVDSFKLRAVVSPQSFFAQNRQVLTALSPKVSITVKPLPTPIPDTFYGGVGRFKIDSEKAGEKREVLYAEPFRHRLRIIGDKSNAKFIKPPKIDLGGEMVVYNTDETFEFIRSKLSSYKDYVYTLIPKKEGLFTPPDSVMTFLDPETEEYYDLFVEFPTFKSLPNKRAGKIKDEDFDEMLGKKPKEEKVFSRINDSAYLDFIFFHINLKIQIAVFFLFILFAAWYFIRNSSYEETGEVLVAVLEKRTQNALKLFDDGDYKNALSELINVYSLLIGGLTGKRFGVEGAFEEASKALPASLKSEERLLRHLNTNLQELRFGSLLESDKNQDKLRKCIEQFQNLFLKMRAYLH